VAYIILCVEIKESFFGKRETVESKNEKKVSVLEDVGNLFLDVGKLTFAGVVLEGIMKKQDVDTLFVFIGFGIAFVFFVVGINLIKKARREI